MFISLRAKSMQTKATSLPSDRAIFLIDISDPLSLPALNSGSIVWILIPHFRLLIDLPIGSIVRIPLHLPMFRD